MKALSLLRKKKSKGFTLVELVIVIAVLAIVAAIAIPTVNGVVANANKATDDSNIQAIGMTIKTYEAQYEAQKTHTPIKAVTDLKADSKAEALFVAYGTVLPSPKGQSGDFLWDTVNKTVSIGTASGDLVKIAGAKLSELKVGVGA